MKKKTRKILRFAVIGCLLSFVVLGIIYSYLAFMPTGNPKLEKERAEAVKRMDSLAQSSIPLLPAVVKPPDDEKPLDIRTKEKTFLKTIDDFENISNAMMMELDQSGCDAGWLYFSIGQHMTSSFTLFHTGVKQNKSALSKLDAQNREKIHAEATLYMVSRKYREKRLNLQPCPTFPREKLHDTLDKIETYLLTSSWSVESSEMVSFSSFRDGFFYLSILAIARASLCGEEEKSASLLEAYLKAYRILVLLRDDEVIFRSRAPVALLLPTELKAFSGPGLARSQSILDSTFLSPEQSEDYIKAKAMDIKNKLQYYFKMEGRRLYHPNSKPAYRHKLNWLPWKVLKPIARRQVETAAICYIEGNKADMQRADKWLDLMKDIMWQCDIKVDWGWVRDQQLILLTQVSGLPRRLNRYNGFLKLFLATTRYKQDLSHFPEQIEDLVPAYIGKDFPASEWGVCRIKEGYFPVCVFDKKSKDASDKEPLKDIVRRFWANEKRLPISAEELRPYLSDPSKLDGFRNRFKWLDETPVVYHISPIESLPDEYTQAKEEIKKILNYRYLVTPEEKNKIERLLVTSPSSIKTAKVVIMSVDYPLISEELKKMLLNVEK